MYTDIIGIKSHMYDKYKVEYATFTPKTWFESTMLYVFLDVDSGAVACPDQAPYIVAWFYKRSEIWL